MKVDTIMDTSHASTISDPQVNSFWVSVCSDIDPSALANKLNETDNMYQTLDCTKKSRSARLLSTVRTRTPQPQARQGFDWNIGFHFVIGDNVFPLTQSHRLERDDVAEVRKIIKTPLLRIAPNLYGGRVLIKNQTLSYVEYEVLRSNVFRLGLGLLSRHDYATKSVVKFSI
jgi:hypothetical protein